MNVIQWMYKKEQVQTTLSNIIQWLSMLDVAPGLSCCHVRKPLRQ